MTDQILQKTYNAVKPLGISRKDHFENIFSDLFSSDEKLSICDTSLSRYYNGKRLFPRKYWARYCYPAPYRVNAASLHYPTQLYDNLLSYLDRKITNHALVEQIYFALLEVFKTVDPVDQPQLLPEGAKAHSSNSEVAELWAILLFYALCQDFAGF